jgi:hypothetical protein
VDGTDRRLRPAMSGRLGIPGRRSVLRDLKPEAVWG